jgi:hypothetical protein
MEKKFSKHFIYNWLQEDNYGEYLLHRTGGDKFTSKLLLKTWNFLAKRRSVQRGSPVPGSFLPRQVEYSYLALRYKFLSFYQSSFTKFRTENLYQLSKLKQFFTNNFLLKHSNTFKILFLIKNYMRTKILLRKTFSLLCQGKLTPWRVYKISLARRARYQFFKRQRLSKLRNTEFMFKLKRSRAISSKFIKLKSKRDRFKRNRSKTKNIWFKKNLRRIRLIRKVFVKKLVPLQYMLGISFESTNLIKFISFWRFFLFNNKQNMTRKIPLIQVVTNKAISSLNLTTLWDNLAYKLKQKLNRFTRLSKSTSKLISRNTQIKLRFRGVFRKPTFVVKKNEIHALLQFRVLNYYNLASNNLDYNKALQSTYYKTRMLQLPSLSYLEFQLVPVLLRSNFFENGYVVNALAKRGVFLLNGTIANFVSTIKVWDIISLIKPLWWIVYARFFNFFCSFLNTTNLQAHIKPKLFMRRLLKFRSLFRRPAVLYQLRGVRSGKLTRLLSTKNYIFALPPAYMEVSYKLFVILIYRLINRALDSNRFLNIRGLKTVLSSQMLRSPQLNLVGR